MSTENFVFQAGGIIFALASIYFLMYGDKKPNFSTEFFISFITTTSYALMNLGISTTTTPGGQTVYWSRWLFYMVTCSLLMYDTAQVLSIPDHVYPKMVILTWLTMFNGFLASYIITASRWVFYILSSIAFFGLLYIVLRGKENPNFTSLKSFVFVGWILFPVVFFLAPTGISFLDTAFAEAWYLVLDIITKIIFGWMTSKLKYR